MRWWAIVPALLLASPAISTDAKEPAEPNSASEAPKRRSWISFVRDLGVRRELPSEDGWLRARQEPPGPVTVTVTVAPSECTEAGVFPPPVPPKPQPAKPEPPRPEPPKPEPPKPEPPKPEPPKPEPPKPEPPKPEPPKPEPPKPEPPKPEPPKPEPPKPEPPKPEPPKPEPPKPEPPKPEPPKPEPPKPEPPKPEPPKPEPPKPEPPKPEPPKPEPPKPEPPKPEPPKPEPPKPEPPKPEPPKPEPPKPEPPKPEPPKPEPPKPEPPKPEPPKPDPPKPPVPPPANPDKPEEPECEIDLLPGGVIKRAITKRQDGDGASCDRAQEHVVYPKDGSNTGQTAAIEVVFATFVTPTGINGIDRPGGGKLFWRVALTPEQAKKVAGSPGVASVEKPCKKDCFDPTTSKLEGREMSHEDWTDDMVLLSQHPDKPLEFYQNKFIYHEFEGKDIDVYILDTGANLKHKDFNQPTGNLLRKTLAKRTRWIHARPDIEKTEDGEGGKQNNHGTGMLACVAGDQTGIARKANPILVRVPKNHYQVEDYMEGLKRAIEDMKGKKPVVILMSLFWPTHLEYDLGNGPQTKIMFPDINGNDISEVKRKTFHDLIKQAVGKGAIIVTGSGNDSKDKMEGFPAGFGAKTAKDYVPEVIVFGNVNRAGKRASTSNRDDAKALPHLYAPGLEISVPLQGSDDAYNKLKSGTSFSAAKGAGLAAYFLALRNEKAFKDKADISTQEKLKDHMISLSWPRDASVPDVKAYFNGIHPDDAQKYLEGKCTIMKRDGAGDTDSLPRWDVCNKPKSDPTTMITTTRPPEETGQPQDKECESAEDCSSPNCTGMGVTSTCEKKGDKKVCVCKSRDPPPPSENDGDKFDWKCVPYDGDRRQESCTCESICKGGKKSCLTIMTKGKDGCDDKCGGCKPDPAGPFQENDIDEADKPKGDGQDEQKEELDWSCKPYIGDREGKQCTCEATCKGGKKLCLSLQVKGQNSCDNECGGCKPDPAGPFQESDL